jgi:hypothetical protein
MDVNEIIKELRAERDEVERAMLALERVGGRRRGTSGNRDTRPNLLSCRNHSFSSVRRPRLLLHSFQLPLEPLYGSANLVGANGGLAIFAVACTHQVDDALQFRFDIRQVLIETLSLLGCRRVKLN